MLIKSKKQKNISGANPLVKFQRTFKAGFTRSLRNSLAPVVFLGRYSNKKVVMLSEIFHNYLIWRKKPRLFSSAGFALVEILVVAGIVALIGGSVATFQRDVITHNSMIQSGAIAEDGLRSILRQIIGELRSAAPAQTGAYLLGAAATNTITFYSDIDSDGLRERTRYFLSGTDFKKGVIKPTGQPYTYDVSNEQIKTVATNVINATTSIFSFYDSNYSGSGLPLTVPIDISKIRLVKIDVGIDPNPGRPLQAMWISSQVMIRNLKDNL